MGRHGGGAGIQSHAALILTFADYIQINHRLGFMKLTEDTVTVISRAKAWQRFSALYVTFFQFHPWLLRLFAMFISVDPVERRIRATLDRIVKEWLEDVSKPDETVTDITRQAMCDYLGEKSHLVPLVSKAVETSEYSKLLPSVLVALLAESHYPARHISSLIYHLSRNEQVVRKLRCELRDLDPPLSDHPTLVEFILRKPHLPYLDALLSESHRLQASEGGDFHLVGVCHNETQKLSTYFAPDEVSADTGALREHCLTFLSSAQSRCAQRSRTKIPR